MCNFSGHTCNKQNLWEVAHTLDNIHCPETCCRQCNVRLCGARCNGSEEPKHIPPIDRYLRYGPHTLVEEVREEAKSWLDQNGVPDFVTWDKNSLPCQNCTWYDGTSCRSGGHTCHYEYEYLICDGFYQSIVERKPSTVGDAFPSMTKPKPQITDDYIRENPTCFYVFGHYLDREQGWHKMPEELPTFREWTVIDVVVFGKKTSTAWMEHGKWEAKDWTFRSLDQRRDAETTEILAWKKAEED